MSSNIDYSREWPILVWSACQVCRGDRLKPFYVVDQPGFSYLMMRCRSCGHIQIGRSQFPPDTKQEQADYFADVAQKPDINWDKLDRRWGQQRYRAFHNIISHLARLGFPGGRLLDIGSAFGHFGYLSTARGYSVLGVEPSPIARLQANEKFGVESVPAIDDVPPAVLPADVVVCAETLFLLTDVRSMLEKIRTRLRPGGCLVVKTRANRAALFRMASLSARLHGRILRLQPGTPLYGWALRAYHLFTTSGIRRLLESSGFEILETVNEREILPTKMTFWAAAKYLRIGFTHAVEAMTLGKVKIGTVITVYATVPS
jgi:2-polyprenyl-3-methyl-5-hydroxy-6-metoxy-1,4-benzoquinol methylase